MHKIKKTFIAMSKKENMNEETIEKQLEEIENETSETASNQNIEDVDVSSEESLEKTDAEKLAQAEEKIIELQDKYLRQVAEFDNYRKRTLKEKAELILNGGEKVITEFLPILDDMERALTNMEKATDVETLREGVDMIFQKMMKTLSSQGLKKIDTEGQSFDTDYHEAIALIPAQEDEQKGKIIDCVQTGYMLNEKVIRHAKVAVGQ